MHTATRPRSATPPLTRTPLSLSPPQVIKRAGIISAGALALLSQAAMCAVAAALFLGYTAAGQSSSQAGWSAAATGLPAPLLLFCVFVALSRIGLWMYDMVDAQVGRDTVALPLTS